MNRQTMSEISESVLTECIKRTFQKNLILRNKMFIIPELALMSDKVCREIIQEDLRCAIAEEDSKLNIYALSAFAGIGSVQSWLEHYAYLRYKGLYRLLTSDCGLINIVQKVCDIANIEFEGQTYLDLLSHTRYLCSFIDMRLKTLLEENECNCDEDTYALETCKILFKVGIAYQVSQVCYVARAKRVNTSEVEPTKTQCFANLLRDFNKKTDSINYKQFDNLNVMLNFLTELEIKSGYELDAFMNGTIRDYHFKVYVCKKNSNIRWQPCKDNITTMEMLNLKTENVTPYNDSMYVQGYLPYTFSKQIPDPLTYFTVKQTELGIIHAWMLHNMHYFMPGGGHYSNVRRDYVYDEESWEDCKKQVPHDNTEWQESHKQMQSICLEDILPKITLNGNVATIECHYWVHCSGLMKSQETATFVNGVIKFSEPTTETIVKYDSGIRFF